MNWTRQYAAQRFFARTSLLIAFCLFSTLLTQRLIYAQAQTYIPTVVTAPAFARTITKLYVAGGALTANLDRSTHQFIYLDLLKPFTSTTPPWTQLANCHVQRLFPAAFSSDEKVLYVFHVPDTNSPWQYSVADDTWQEVTTAKFGNAGWEGIGAVTDPKSGLIYLAGGYDDVNANAASMKIVNIFDPVSQTINTQDLPPPEKVFPIRWYYGNVWSRNRSSIVYWGGVNRFYKVTVSPVENGVTEFSPDLMDWFTMPIQGVAPAVKVDHCMTANDDGTKIAIYGGRFRNRTVSDELWTLDLVTYTWTQGPSGPPRYYAACTIAGDQFLVWGGSVSPTEIASSEMLIYDMKGGKWVKEYTPPPFYKDLLPPPALRRVTAPWPTKTLTGGAKGDGGSGGMNGSIAGEKTSSLIVGGVIGGVALLGAFSGIFFLRWRQYRRQKQGLRAVTGASQVGQGGDGRRFAERAQWKDPQCVAIRNEPQVVEQSYSHVDRTLQELVEQQRQLEQKRQLLVLKQHGLTTYTTNTTTGSPDLVSSEQLRAPALLPGAKSEYLSSPSSTSSSSPTPPLPMSSTPSFNPESLYADLLLSTASLTPIPTVQMIPLVANDGGYADGYEGVRSGAGTRKESDLNQEMVEPMYGSGPPVSAAVQDVVYMPSHSAGME